MYKVSRLMTNIHFLRQKKQNTDINTDILTRKLVYDGWKKESHLTENNEVWSN